MGFCRRCGDIVSGPRCKCGGSSVAPVVPFKQANYKGLSPDKWSQTYVSRERSPSPTRRPNYCSKTEASHQPLSPSSPTKRFPRPISTSTASTATVGSHITDYILSATSPVAQRPSSPLKYSTVVGDPDLDILPSVTPHDTTLSKVYGSVLQPKESLSTHSCAICITPFPPDATIYPHPSPKDSLTQDFMCQSCYVSNGGSKGACVGCHRPVLTVKTDGGFVQTSNKYWHKRCFNCEGCFKNIGDAPMVDLLGRPSCADCFDSCLKRESKPSKRSYSSDTSSPKAEQIANPGGMRINTPRKSRESSPAIEELEVRLGITKSRENSPAAENISQRYTDTTKNSKTGPFTSWRFNVSPGNDVFSADHSDGTVKNQEKPTISDQISKESAQSSKTRIIHVPPETTGPNIKSIILSSNSKDNEPNSAQQPYSVNSDLSSEKSADDFAENQIRTPQRTSIPRSRANSTPASTSSRRMSSSPATCSSPSKRNDQLESESMDTIEKPSLSASPLDMKSSHILASFKKDGQVPLSASATPASICYPRFGSKSACPGCRMSVSPMELGVVPGPQGTRWHASCLVCGGKKTPPKEPLWLLRRDREPKKNEPGCGKRLDSAAKSDGEGGVWCRECLLLVVGNNNPQLSPIRSQHYLSQAEKVAPQLTGTTLARQHTGIGGDSELLRHLTGGGIGVTRSISPTKQLGSMRPRPKSMMGPRSTKSIDEGRGMFLVRQMTGCSST